MSSSWRDSILKEFVPQLSRLTLAADPDGILAEVGMQDALMERGFEVVEFQDSIAFRYLYETNFRPRWQAGETFELVIVLRSDQAALSRLPFDLLQAGRRLSFSLSDLFPKLTYHEVAALEHSDLDVLYQAQAKLGPASLGENATKDFILEHVFGIPADRIRNEAELLTALIRIHHSDMRLPAPFVEHLAQKLGRRNGFSEWPLRELLSDSGVLHEFLQERWPYYLDKEAAQQGQPFYDAGAKPTYALNWRGPQLLPFGQPDIKALVDTLFLEGKLRPVAHPLSEKLKHLWVAVGLKQDGFGAQQRLARLLDQLEKRLPKVTDRHQEWQSFAPAWAEAIVLQHSSAAKLDPATQGRIEGLQAAVDGAFQEWLGRKYRFLSTLPPDPPVMVHHIPRSLARQVNMQPQKKVALIVVDGLAFDQWLIVRASLADRLPEIRIRESAVFAWIPTVTSVSRQAIFSGKLPLYFPDSILTTAKEANHWSLFWENEGLPSHSVGYAKALRTSADFDRVEELLTRPNSRAVGLVVDEIDHMMHGITLGTPGLHRQLLLWLEGGFLAELISRLWQDAYQVYLTSDHGNIAARGIGRPSEGSLANVRGERVRIYPNQTLRETVQQRFPESISWSVDGLPADFFPLLAPDRRAFVPEGETTVSHGGSLLEEVVVPFVRIERREI